MILIAGATTSTGTFFSLFVTTAKYVYAYDLLSSGFASPHHPGHGSLSYVRSPSIRFVVFFFPRRYNVLSFGFFRREFEMIGDGLSDALDFSPTIGANARVANAYERGGQTGTLGEADFYTRYVVVHAMWPDLINNLVATSA